jgi:excisionase family DNA binding protein
MKPATPSLDQMLTRLDRRQVLQCLAFVQARQARDATIKGLLHARLAQLTSAPPVTQPDTLLMVADVARTLSLSKPRVYELVRNGDLPAVTIGQRQLRVRQRDLDRYLSRTRDLGGGML